MDGAIFLQFALPKIPVPQHASVLTLRLRIQDAVPDRITESEGEPLDRRYLPGQLHQLVSAQRLLAGKREQDHMSRIAETAAIRSQPGNPALEPMVAGGFESAAFSPRISEEDRGSVFVERISMGSRFPSWGAPSSAVR